MLVRAKLWYFSFSVSMRTIYSYLPDCERGFSQVKLVKTGHRNRLSQPQLNHLILLTVEGPAPEKFPFDEAVDLWAAVKQRRINTT